MNLELAVERGEGLRRCVARTKAGARCRNLAAGDGDLCSPHAGLNVAGEAARQAGRACTGMTNRGRPCRDWAARGSEPPRCARHGEGGGRARARGGAGARRRCEAKTKRGKACRGWPLRDGVEGRALCAVHAGGWRRPRGRQRCTATASSGKRCAQWAVRGSERVHGAGLCPAHLPVGDARRSRLHRPGPGERRCRALTVDGERCAHWALADHWSDERSRGLCWIHAYPEAHPTMTHGYYRRVALLSPAERAAIARLKEEGAPLAAELVMVRLKLRGVFAYTGRGGLPAEEMDRTALLAYCCVRAVVRLVKAQKGWGTMNWRRNSVGGTGQMLEHVCRVGGND